MRRRTFFSVTFACLAIGFGALGAVQFLDNRTAGYGYAAVGVGVFLLVARTV